MFAILVKDWLALRIHYIWAFLVRVHVTMVDISGVKMLEKLWKKKMELISDCWKRLQVKQHYMEPVMKPLHKMTSSKEIIILCEENKTYVELALIFF